MTILLWLILLLGLPVSFGAPLCENVKIPEDDRSLHTAVPYLEPFSMVCTYKIPRRAPTCDFDILWYKDGILLDLDSPTSRFKWVHHRSKQNKIRLVDNIKETDSGNYSCVITSDTIPLLRESCSQSSILDTSCHSVDTMRFFFVTVKAPFPSTQVLLPNIVNRMEYSKVDVMYWGLSMLQEGDKSADPSNDLNDPFQCRVFLLTKTKLEEEDWPQFTWYFQSDNSQIANKIVNGSDNTYFNSGKHRCGEKYVSRDQKMIAKKRRLYLNCFITTLNIRDITWQDKGDYICNATYKDQNLKSRRKMLININLQNLGPQSFVALKVNSSTCLERPLIILCEFRPASSRTVLVKIISKTFKDYGSLYYSKVPLSEMNGDYQTVATSDTHSTNDRILLTGDDGKPSQWIQGLSGMIRYIVPKATANDSSTYVCYTHPKDKYIKPSYNVAHITMDNCSKQADRPLLMIIFLALLFVVMIAAVFGAIISACIYHRRKNQPIIKRIILREDKENQLYKDTANLGNRLLPPRSGIPYRSLSHPRTDSTSTQPEEIRVPSVSIVRPHAQDRLGDNESDGHRPVRYEIPKDPVWEIQRGRVRVGHFLGEGSFGTVFYGEIFNHRGIKGVTPVAIKRLKKDFSEEDLSDLMSEIAILKQIKNHPNIVSLKGVATKNGPLCILVEFAPHGNMREFLKNRPPRCSRSEWNLYQNTLPEKPVLSEKDLVEYSVGIANGLEYLSSIPVVHRDIAARNILMGDNVIPKIADFGMTRNITEYYRKLSTGRLPIKWLAPECLSERKFTTKSDVWAYGILLYEMFSFGCNPYPSVSSDRMFEFLQNGGRNGRPSYAQDEIWQIMQDCWSSNPQDRPAISQVKSRLARYLDSGASDCEL